MAELGEKRFGGDPQRYDIVPPKVCICESIYRLAETEM